MTAVILCPGPSLAQVDEIPVCDLSIAVNRAALRFSCDIWAACDYPMIRDNAAKVLGNPKLLTRRQTWEDIGKRCGLELAALVDDLICDVNVNWRLKTMTCAMVYAHSCGANQIDIFGCDWSGDADYDGMNAGEDRTAKRWEAERRDMLGLMEWMNGAGVDVRRN